jgi:hypothetical protein
VQKVEPVWRRGVSAGFTLLCYDASRQRGILRAAQSDLGIHVTKNVGDGHGFAPVSESWVLFRVDDHGNRFVMARFATRAAAEAEARRYEDRGHKQLYCVEAGDCESPTPVAASRCPLCGRPNDCAAARTGGFDAPCWCRDLAIAAETLARIPAQARGRACLCRQCAGAEDAAESDGPASGDSRGN